LKRLIRILAEEGKTILISSHILSELGEMCDTLLFVDKGKLVHHGTAEALQRGTAEVTTFDVQVAEAPEKLWAWIQVNPHVRLMEERRLGARIEIDSIEPNLISAVLRRMVQDGLTVTEFHREERNLEDAFIDMLGKLEAKGNVAAS
jgi:ABC-2 type transport system ATP-binding protein